MGKKKQPSKVGYVAWTTRLIPAYPLALPTGAKVMVVEDRGGRFMVRPDDSRFPSVWIDPDGLRFG